MRNKYIRAIIFILIFACFFGCAAVCADEGIRNIPYQSYYFWENANGKKAVADRDILTVSEKIDGNTLGISSFSQISDIYAANNGKIYVLDSGNGRIVILNRDYTLNRIISSFSMNGEQQQLNQPQGIFVEDDGSMIIADTENMRLLFSDPDGIVKNVITSPKGDIIPDDLQFYPIISVRDDKGFLYILSRGSYYGALTYDKNGEFCGFYGSNPVITNPIEQIERIFNRVFTNNDAFAYKVQKLPYQFSDLCVGSDGFLYTVSPNTASMTGQLRKLSISGSNILAKTDGFNTQNADIINFGEKDPYVTNMNNRVPQNFSGVTVDKNGFIYALDAAYGKIYMYDAGCNSVTVVGGGMGTGDQNGIFKKATAIEATQDALLVSDGEKNCITIFNLTKYGKLVYKADLLYQNGDYAEAGKYWKEVLKLSTNFQLAYKGLAQTTYIEGDYDASMQYAKAGDDQPAYARAYSQVIGLYVKNNLWWLSVLGVLMLGCVTATAVICKKKRIVILKNIKIKTLLSSVIHPFNSFYDMKFRGYGSLSLTVLVIALFYVVTILKSLCGGFMYVIVDVDDFNALLILAGTVGLIVLFAVSNWALCSLFEGKGTLHEVFYVTACALIPQLINGTFYIVATHLIVPGTSAAVTSFAVVCLIWSAFILMAGLVSIHDFGFIKTFLTILLTIGAIILIIFILFMMFTFFQNFISFIVSLFREVIARY